VVDGATYAASALLLAFAGYRVVVDRRGVPDPAMRYVCWFAVSLGSALLVLTPRTMAALDRYGPATRLGVLAGAELKLCGLTSPALVARTPTGPDRGPARRPARRAAAPPAAASRTGGTIGADVAWLLMVAEAFGALVAAGAAGGGRGRAGEAAAGYPGAARLMDPDAGEGTGGGTGQGKKEPRPGRGDQAGAVTR
jgi:hypothetical protein